MGNNNTKPHPDHTRDLNANIDCDDKQKDHPETSIVAIESSTNKAHIDGERIRDTLLDVVIPLLGGIRPSDQKTKIQDLEIMLQNERAKNEELQCRNTALCEAQARQKQEIEDFRRVEQRSRQQIQRIKKELKATIRGVEMMKSTLKEQHTKSLQDMEKHHGSKLQSVEKAHDKDVQDALLKEREKYESYQRALAKEKEKEVSSLLLANEAALLSVKRETEEIVTKIISVVGRTTLVAQMDQPFKSSKAYNSCDGSAEWYWEENGAFKMSQHDSSLVLEGTNFVRYTHGVSYRIEQGYQKYVAGNCTILVIRHGGSKYIIDFKLMTQENEASGHKRKVFRKQNLVATIPLPLVPDDIRDFDNSDGDDDDFELLQVSRGQLVQVISFHRSGEWILGHVISPQELANPSSYKTLSQEDPVVGWLPLFFTGPVDQHAIKRLVINDNPPATWTLDHTLTSIKLNKSSEEYQTVERFFVRSFGAKAPFISSIQRIENLPLWKCYAAKKASMQLKVDLGMKTQVNNKKDIERCWLFHGTSAETASKIIRQGFNRSYTFQREKEASYGKGVYFASNASTARNFAPPDKDNLNYHQILVCRVLVGDWCQGAPGMLLPESKYYDPLELYDSTVNKMNEDPSIFVTYHDAQAYPEYLITFGS